MGCHGRPAFSGAIRVHMSSLRKKLKAKLGYDPIQNKVGKAIKYGRSLTDEKNVASSGDFTCITTLCIAIICGCLTMFVYKNGVHYIDSLQDAVESTGDEKETNQMKYISAYRTMKIRDEFCE